MAEYGWDFLAREERDGLRFTWNEWPAMKGPNRTVVPIAALYSPFKQIASMPPRLEYEPVRCKQMKCGAVLNPYCQVEFMSKQWTCPFCTFRNPFPPHYAEHITETNLPAELIPSLTTVEYQLPGKVASPPAFLFVVDLGLPDEELDKLKESIIQATTGLPPSALVGLISYGTMVTVHELSSADIPKSFVFKGTKDYDGSVLQTLLSLSPGAAAPMGAPAGSGVVAPTSNKFLAPIGECMMTFEQILTDLAHDPWPTAATDRPARAVGAALRISECVLEKVIGKQGARIMMFMGGPCTTGPGQVVNRPLIETMRGHSEISSDSAPYVKSATAFYNSVAVQAANNGHVIDIFACSLDQVGIVEMKNCVTHTGGLCVLADSFKQSVFQDSFVRVFRQYDDAHADAKNILMGFSATLEVTTSRDYKISGALGPCVSLRKPSPCVSDTEVGEGGTFAWSLGGLDPTSTLAIIFDAGKEGSGAVPGKRHFLQLVTYYQHSNGKYRMRVTTTGGMWSADASSLASVAASFDQEAAAVVMARLAVTKAERDEPGETMRWLDKSLIKLCHNFAEYTKNDPSSFRLSPNFAVFPQFMFHLRRSNFMQILNSSPDEAAYHRLILCREDVSNSMLMIQPSLMCYSFTAPPQPVLLDAASIRPDVILLLDTFFHVLIFHGETIAAWREQKYQEREEHVAFRQLLEQPKEDAAVLMESRFPVPRYIVCDQHKSQARFLLSRVNPSVTHNNVADAHGSNPVITDDVPLTIFMEHLVRLAVQEE